MVENVLAHARLEEHSAPRRVESITLESLLTRVTPPLAQRARLSGMDLQIDNADGATPLEFDAEAIGRILCNLVDNAAKYAHNGSAPRVHLEASIQNDLLRLSVRDHGPGIAAEQSGAIFAPFERGGRDPADPVPGVGLGLALARRMARDMGGDLTLDRSVGIGACFLLCLPRGTA
jgi:signal transduction histidine kinase